MQTEEQPRNLTFAQRSGPNTIVAVFAYGGVHSQTLIGVVNDACKAAYAAGQAHARDESLRQYGAEVPPLPIWEVRVVNAPQDAMVSRGRAICVKSFLETNAEVLIMLDHDLAWRPPTKDYEGDLLHLARKCAETKSIVGACVSKKTKGQGIASMWAPGAEGEYSLGSDTLVEALFVGAAFTAYHRSVLERVVEFTRAAELGGREEVVPGFVPIFGELIVQHPHQPHQMLHLSEDWALCERWRRLGGKSWLTMKPLVTHFGYHGFTVVGDSGIAEKQPEPEVPQRKEPDRMNYTSANGVLDKDGFFRTSPLVSLIHATRGRPEQATETIKRWVELASPNPPMEYILSIDDDDVTMADWTPPPGIPVHVVVGPSRGCVDAYNRGFAKSRGDICIQVHDDLDPPRAYNETLARLLDVTKPQLLRVDDGCHCNDHKPDLITLAIGTRKFFEQLGGMFWPEYISVFCDDDMSAFAKKYGYILDARHILFKHRWAGPDRDETQKRSYHVSNWEQGRAVLKRRTEAGFPVQC